jgi:hypothetical protein
LPRCAARAHGVAEGAVKRAGVFGAVGHDAGVDVALHLKRLADRADAPVHHVAGRHDVHARFGVGEGLAGEHLHRFVIDDVAGVVEHAVLAVAGVGVERHVGHHAQVRKLFFQRPHHARDQAVGVERLLAVGCFEGGVDGREQRQHRNAELHAVFGHRQQQIQAQAVHAGHGRHGLALVLALVHEHGIDQVVGRDGVLAHQVAGKAVTAQAAWAALRKGGGAGEVHGGIMKPPASLRPAPRDGGRGGAVVGGAAKKGGRGPADVPGWCGLAVAVRAGP